MTAPVTNYPGLHQDAQISNFPSKPSKTRKIIETVVIVAIAIIAVAAAATIGLLLSGLTVGIIASAATAVVIAIGIIAYKIIQNRQQRKTIPPQSPLNTTARQPSHMPVQQVIHASVQIQNTTLAPILNNTATQIPQTTATPLTTLKAPSVTSLKLSEIIVLCKSPKDFVAKSAEILNKTLEELGYTLGPQGFAGNLTPPNNANYSKEILHNIHQISEYLIQHHRDYAEIAVKSPSHSQPLFEEFFIYSQVLVSCYNVFLHQSLHGIRPADSELRANENESITHLEYWISQHKQAIKNATIKTGENNIWNSLIYTISHGKLQLESFVPLLLKYGWDLMALPGFNDTLLLAIIRQGNKKVAGDILKGTEDFGLPKNYLDIQLEGLKITALHVTAGKGDEKTAANNQTLEPTNLSLASQLLKLGARKDLQDAFGNTPLHLAALRRDYEMIRLVDDPAIRTVKNTVGDGYTAFELLSASYEEVTELLKEYGFNFSLNESEFNDPANHLKMAEYLKQPIKP